MMLRSYSAIEAKQLNSWKNFGPKGATIVTMLSPLAHIIALCARLVSSLWTITVLGSTIAWEWRTKDTSCSLSFTWWLEQVTCASLSGLYTITTCLESTKSWWPSFQFSTWFSSWLWHFSQPGTGSWPFLEALRLSSGRERGSEMTEERPSYDSWRSVTTCIGSLALTSFSGSSRQVLEMCLLLGSSGALSLKMRVMAAMVFYLHENTTMRAIERKVEIIQWIQVFPTLTKKRMKWRW